MLGEHSLAAESLVNLGVVLLQMGDLPGFVSSLDEGLAMRKKTLGENHEETAAVAEWLGDPVLEVQVHRRPTLSGTDLVLSEEGPGR